MARVAQTQYRQNMPRSLLTRLVISVTAAAGILGGCTGNDSPKAVDTASGVVAETSVGEGVPVGTAAPAVPSGSVNCKLIRDPTIVQSLIGLQILPQLRSQSTVDSLRNGILNYKPADLATYLEALIPLGGTSYGPFGDPADAIAKYVAANKKAGEILELEGPVPQAKFDELAAIVGDIGTFIGAQAGIGAAIDEVCPK